MCAHPYIHVHILTCMGTTYLYTKKEKKKKKINELSVEVDEERV